MIVEVRGCIARGTEGCLDVEDKWEDAGSKGGSRVIGVVHEKWLGNIPSFMREYDLDTLRVPALMNK